MAKKLLLGLAYRPNSYTSVKTTRDMSRYRAFLERTFPEMRPWIDRELFESLPDWPAEARVLLTTDCVNIPGRFLAGNLATPTTVIDEPVTPTVIREYLERDNYTHVGLSVYVDAYSEFARCARAVKAQDPGITVVAGNVGALFEPTNHHVDVVCTGRGVPFLRELLGEPVDAPYRPVIIPDRLHAHYMGREFVTDRVNLVTKIGCPHACDFCITNQLFGGRWSGHLMTPEAVYRALVEYRSELGRNFQVYICEPTAFLRLAWWYRLFELFEQAGDDYPVYLNTTARSLQRFDLARVRESALRLANVNFGVESFHDTYAKNAHVDLKALVHRYRDSGVRAYLSYIIGFDHHTRASVHDEVTQLLDLDAALYCVLNLRPLPRTPLWTRLARAGRLLEVPPDFFYLPGFQPYTHPHFRPGFTDMLPLMYDVETRIQRERGDPAFQATIHLQHLLAWRKKNRAQIVRQLQAFRAVARLVYPAWRRFFRPGDKEERAFREILDFEVAGAPRTLDGGPNAKKFKKRARVL